MSKIFDWMEPEEAHNTQYLLLAHLEPKPSNKEDPNKEDPNNKDPNNEDPNNEDPNNSKNLSVEAQKKLLKALDLLPVPDNNRDIFPLISDRLRTWELAEHGKSGIAASSSGMQGGAAEAKHSKHSRKHKKP
ncbi:hypothetical protein T439DRAFT_359429 [Meredithblackwellia eburnea MCA 4105]